jgi:methylated-DNA-[protein]-cysteine S-methyltransferase
MREPQLRLFARAEGDARLDGIAQGDVLAPKYAIPAGPSRPRARPAEAFDAVVAAPFGAIGIAVDGGRIASLSFLPPGTSLHRAQDSLVERAGEQIRHYFDDPDAEFDLPLTPVGTIFQRRVWDQIASIPSGQTRRYGEIARALGSEARAVGQACGDNRFPLVIPCHRVVAASGLGGFAHANRGFYLRVKQWLLMHELR